MGRSCIDRYVSSCEFIISTDVSDERFIRTRLPDSEKKICKGNYALIVMDGCLSFVHTISFKEIDVWILKDFHGQVWLKKHSIVTQSAKYPPLMDSSFPRECQNDLPDLRRLVV
ncbi:hypothetical protein PVL29_010390 [Vitis rotundifolia]|uniref:F-box associated domain-containing protein n=1 Tax=Vitis rotundifolia TaxID=103349 RepID=A0AA38ZTG0_VITRO|nr:hypothetical protein PVL29_010390 [Vitis rotundifolia]